MFLEQMISQCLWRASSWKNLAADRSCREQYSHTEWGTGVGIRNYNTCTVAQQALVKSLLPPWLQCCVCAKTQCLHSTDTAWPTETQNSTGFNLSHHFHCLFTVLSLCTHLLYVCPSWKMLVAAVTDWILKQKQNIMTVALDDNKILTWKILYLTWLISIQVFSAAGRFWSSDLNLDETEEIGAFIYSCVGIKGRKTNKQQNSSLPGWSCKQQNFMCIKRFPLHQESNIRHVLVVKEVGVWRRGQKDAIKTKWGAPG